MKLLDKALNKADEAFDRAIEMARPVQALAEGLKLCAAQMEKIAGHIAVIAHNQAVHHQMITQMYGTQQAIFSRLRESSLDTSMPDIDKPKQLDDDKQDDKKKAKAASKPN